MPTPLLSVIVPVYNVEDYLPDCVRSILSQTFDDFELILVDDGSPDKCPQMCDEFARMDPRIKVIHQDNAGLSAARNSGMSIVQGKYITFVDSDDTIDPDTFAGNIPIMESNPSIDMLQFPMAFHSERKNYYFSTIPHENIFLTTCDDILAEWIPRAFLNSSVCCKIFSRASIKSCPFQAGKKYEDMFFMADYLPTINCCCISKLGQYNYYLRDDSICQTPSVQSAVDFFEAECLRLIVARQRLNNLSGFQYKSFDRLINYLCQLKKNQPSAVNHSHYSLLRQCRPTWRTLTHCRPWWHCIVLYFMYYFLGIRITCIIHSAIYLHNRSREGVSLPEKW